MVGRGAFWSKLPGTIVILHALPREAGKVAASSALQRGLSVVRGPSDLLSRANPLDPNLPKLPGIIYCGALPSVRPWMASIGAREARHFVKFLHCSFVSIE